MSPVVRVGLISDTHGLLRPQALDALAGVNHIVHAGDIGSPDILRRLGEVAPVTVVRGNNDVAEWARSLPLVDALDVGDVRIQVVHELRHLPAVDSMHRGQVVVYGHSHRPAVERRCGFLYVNPGSAGPRRFKLPVSVGMLRVRGADVGADILDLL